MSLITHDFPTASDLNDAFALRIADLLVEAINSKGKASIAVSGGSTPKPLFAKLAALNIDWHKVTVTLVDDRWVKVDHEASNEKLVHENLLVKYAQKAQFVSLITDDVNAVDAEKVISDRIDAIDENIDVLILGMGEDGHTASLFPCSEQLKAGLDMSRKLSAIATQPTTAPHQRMSMSLAKILSAKHIFLHLVGAKKKVVLNDALANFTELEKPIKAVCNNTTVTLMWAP